MSIWGRVTDEQGRIQVTCMYCGSKMPAIDWHDHQLACEKIRDGLYNGELTTLE